MQSLGRFRVTKMTSSRIAVNAVFGLTLFAERHLQRTVSLLPSIWKRLNLLETMVRTPGEDYSTVRQVRRRRETFLPTPLGVGVWAAVSHSSEPPSRRGCPQGMRARLGVPGGKNWMLRQTKRHNPFVDRGVVGPPREFGCIFDAEECTSYWVSALWRGNAGVGAHVEKNFGRLV